MNPKKLITPPALKPGASLALIRPAGRFDEKRYQENVRELRKLGFCVCEYPRRSKKDSFFSASDRDRALEFAWAFSEPGIDAVLSVRGGYGTHRLIDAFERLPQKVQKAIRPKIFVGYSDVTYLHQYLQNQWGWKTFHGPLTGALPPAALKSMMKDLLALPSQSSAETWSEAKVLSGGKSSKARGRLVGGNLSLLQTSGPAALPKNVPLILALEDVNENFYQIDRMLRVLVDAGYRENVKGLLLGTFVGCGKDDARTFRWSRVQESLRELCAGPILKNIRFGHGLKTQRLLPLGSQVEVSGKKIRVLGPVVAAG